MRVLHALLLQTGTIGHSGNRLPFLKRSVVGREPRWSVHIDPDVSSPRRSPWRQLIGRRLWMHAVSFLAVWAVKAFLALATADA